MIEKRTQKKFHNCIAHRRRCAALHARLRDSDARRSMQTLDTLT